MSKKVKVPVTAVSFRGTREDVDVITAAARLAGIGAGDLVRLALEDSPEARRLIGRIMPSFFANGGNNSEQGAENQTR